MLNGRTAPVLLAALACAGQAARPSASAPPPVDEHAHAHTLAHDGMNAEKEVQIELGADAAFDPRGILWAVHKFNRHVAVSRSADLGRSWSQPVLVTLAPEPTDPGGDAQPKIALGPGGEIYVTWTRPLDLPFSGEIKFSRSLDGGRTFQAPIVVHRDRQVITHRFDTLAVNSTGQVFAAWIDKRDVVAAAKAGDPPYRGAAVYFAVSDDRGATFRGDFKVADHSCECCRIALTPRADGTVLAMWRHIFAPNVRDHAVATLHADGTATSAGRATFEDWRLDACPHHGPSIAVDADGRAHAVWFSGAPDRRGIFYGRLRPGGLDGLRQLGSLSAANPSVAIDGPRVAVAWKVIEAGRTRLCGMVSEDGGTAWQEFALLTVTGATDHPRVLAHGGRFHVLWNTREHPLSVTVFPERARAFASHE